MRTHGVLATAIAAMLLLGGCASSTSHASVFITPSPSATLSIPAFLSTLQTDADELPDGVPDRMQVDATSSRYQGDWDEHQVFLATTTAGAVCVVTGIPDHADTWASGCGAGNGVVTSEFPDGGVVKYLPMTTSAAPQGWTRVSDHVFAM
jgi:hypothetical protein